MNEEIPSDSLAATGTRFQRQVRTERVRPPGSRARAQSGSQPQPRGHTRNALSGSSISSMGSMYSQRDARRPPPLVMGDARNRLSQEFREESPANPFAYRPPSPGGFSTPNSATFSTGQNSPRWGSGMQSPISSHSRTASIYAGHRTPGRRLSVPSAGNPFNSPHSYGPPPIMGMAPSAPNYSPSSSMVTSPTSSTGGSTWSRRESASSATDEAWRRRTWHPDTYSSFTSRLQNVMTPNYYSNGPPPQPPNILPSNATALQLRLPGIESFDPLPRPSAAAESPARAPSPMAIDTPSRLAPVPQREEYSERPTSSHWDMGIQRNLNRLDITQSSGPVDAASSWASEANRAVQAQAEQAQSSPSVRFDQFARSPRPVTSSYRQHPISAPPVTPIHEKRRAWFQGPLSHRNGIVDQVETSAVDPRMQRTSPADSSSSESVKASSGSNFSNPTTAHVNTFPVQEPRTPISAPQNSYTHTFHVQEPRTPASIPNNGYYSSNGNENSYTYTSTHLQTPHQNTPKSRDNDYQRLETLVAVAANEKKVTAAAF